MPRIWKEGQGDIETLRRVGMGAAWLGRGHRPKTLAQVRSTVHKIQNFGR
jgi:hypothetical protein